MEKEEIDRFIEDRFNGIAMHFCKAFDNFEMEPIRQFRTEIKKLKAFFHLLNMESDDGFAYRITKRMKTIYGYLGVIRNFQLQLKKTKDFLTKNDGNFPTHYINMLERELEFWKKTSKDFLYEGYDFFDDKKEILTTLPDKLSEKSIRKFIHYTLYELQLISGHSDDYSLDSGRKFMEDIYYNYALIKPFITKQQTSLFDEKEMDECMKLSCYFRDKCIAIALLQTFKADESEEQFLKQMENNWLNEKIEMKNQLSAKLDSMDIKANNLNEYAFAGRLND